jgi:chitinase
VALRSAILLQALLSAACGDVILPVIEAKSEPGSSTDGGPQPAGFPPGSRLAAYWGQDLYGATNPESPLADTCTNGPYDIVIAAYVTQIALGADGSPASFSFNMANHCGTMAIAPDACDAIGAGIQACHDMGKKVLISIGPQDPGLPPDDDGSVGVQAARSVWDMFLGGDAGPRPFGGASFDGVDLDYHVVAPSAGYPAFVAELRRLMTASGGQYYLTAAPQCGFPDAIYLAAGGPLDKDRYDFDALFVKFYYDPCAYGGQDGGLEGAFQDWATVPQDGHPKIFVGLPVSSSLAKPGYVDRAALRAIVESLKRKSAFGGIMLLDVSYDQNSADDAGTTYGRFVKSVLQ